MTRQKLQIKCALCGKKVISKEQNSGVEKIDGTSYTFDSYEGVLTLNRCIRLMFSNILTDFSIPWINLTSITTKDISKSIFRCHDDWRYKQKCHIYFFC